MFRPKIPHISQFFVERLQVARNLTSPLCNLHEIEIIFRDLKPENIGFDANGTLKLFDFGFAKQFCKRHKLAGGYFRVTSFVGTHPYKSLEVSSQRAYGQSLDVSAFGLILWEIISLKEPYNNILTKYYAKKVLKGRVRPKICKQWPEDIARLIEDCWDPKPGNRPSMASTHKLLDHELKAQSFQ
jgi:serine/threonine protein kinase